MRTSQEIFYLANTGTEEGGVWLIFAEFFLLLLSTKKHPRQINN